MNGGVDPKLQADRGLKAELRWVVHGAGIRQDAPGTPGWGLRHPEPWGRRLGGGERFVTVPAALQPPLHSAWPPPAPVLSWRRDVGLLYKDAEASTPWDLGCTHGWRGVWLFLPKLPNLV